MKYQTGLLTCGGLALVMYTATVIMPAQAASVQWQEAGSDAGSAAGHFWEATKEDTGKAWDATRETSGKAWEATKAGSARAWNKTREVSGEAWDKSRDFTVETWDRFTGDGAGMAQQETDSRQTAGTGDATSPGDPAQ